MPAAIYSPMESAPPQGFSWMLAASQLARPRSTADAVDGSGGNTSYLLLPTFYLQQKSRSDFSERLFLRI